LFKAVIDKIRSNCTCLPSFSIGDGEVPTSLNLFFVATEERLK
jgi:hypothetical protein